MSEQIQETQAQEPVQLKIADLLLCAQVIQLASARGAVKPEEFTQVGGLYERLVTFLQASGALTQADQSAEEPAGDSSGTELPAA